MSNVKHDQLTKRELEILTHLANRLTDQEIADNLFLELTTVKWYNRQIYSKLRVKNRREAAVRAESLGLLKGDELESPISIKNLPVQTTPFIGRADELSDLERLLKEKHIRLVTLLAPGGMGKTRLATKLVEKLSTDFNDGVFFIPLNELISEEHLISTIAESVGLRLQPGGNPSSQVFQHLRDKQILLVLDNIENIQTGLNFVADLLLQTPEIKLLTTSRKRLNLMGETIFPVGGLKVPDKNLPIADLAKFSAVTLFIQIAQNTHPSFKIHQNDWKDIVKICQLVMGMPLGIVLAATWVNLFSPAEIAAEITKSMDILSTDLYDIPERHRSIRAVFASTWTQLVDEERESIEKLSVFRGGFDRQAGQKITDTSLHTLRLLAERGMLSRTALGRFEVHELIRQYAEEQLGQSAYYRITLDSHANYYANLLDHLYLDMRSRQQRFALGRVEENIENMKSAWDYFLGQKNHATIAAMVPGFYYFFESQGWYQEGRGIFERAVMQFSSGVQKPLLGRLYARLGAFEHRLGDYQNAAKSLKDSLSMLQNSGDDGELAYTVSFMADLSRSLGDYEASRKLCQKSLSLFDKVNDKWGIAGELHNLGVAAYHLGEMEEAQNFYEKSLVISRDLGDPYGTVTSLIAIGVLLQDMGKYDEAKKLYLKSFTISEGLDDLNGIIASTINLGRVDFLMGNLKSAKKYSQAGFEISNELGDRWGIAASLINLGDITCYLENQQDARMYFRDALIIVMELNSEPLTVEILVGMADLLAKTGEYEEAVGLLMPLLNRAQLDNEIRERVDRLREEIETELSTPVFHQIQNKNVSLETSLKHLHQLL
jgi:predicted ATPase/DNA-binding CsgD family transcriptional regulator